MVPAAGAAGDGLQRHGRDVDEQRAGRRCVPRAVERHAERGVCRRDDRARTAFSSSTTCASNSRSTVLPSTAVARDAVEALERRVPANHAVAGPDHQQPIVERLEDVLVEGVQAIELGRLEVQLPIEAAVLDGGRGLRGHGGDQRGVFGAERLAAGAPAERQHGDRGVLGDARHEVVDAGVAPELDLFGGEPGRRQRIVEPHGMRAVADATPMPDAPDSFGGALLEALHG